MQLPQDYSRLQIGLHWLSAIIILWALVSGSLFRIVEVSAELKESVTHFNVSLTMLFIPFFILRAYLAFSTSSSARGCGPNFMERLARIAHCAIYVLTTVVLISGVLMMKDRADFFGFLYFGPVLTQPTLHEWFGDLHIWSCVALAALVVLHIVAVIRHQISGNSVIKRMWP